MFDIVSIWGIVVRSVNIGRESAMSSAILARKTASQLIKEYTSSFVVGIVCFAMAIFLSAVWIFNPRPAVITYSLDTLSSAEVVNFESLATKGGIYGTVTMHEFRLASAGQPYTIGIWSGWRKGREPDVSSDSAWKIWYFSDQPGLTIVATENVPYIRDLGYWSKTTFDAETRTFLAVPDGPSYMLLVPIFIFLFAGSFCALLIAADV